MKISQAHDCASTSKSIAESLSINKGACGSVIQNFTQEMIDKSPRQTAQAISIAQLQPEGSGSVVQFGKRKKKKGKESEEVAVWQPQHNQEAIQDYIIGFWRNSPSGDLDQLRANYMQTYSATEGGWCDGWTYALSQGGDRLGDIWQEIDDALTTNEHVSGSTLYDAIEMARSAALYHVMNNPAPTPGTPQRTDYDNAFGFKSSPSSREEWKHDPHTNLELYVIKEEIAGLDEGDTLRLTSAIHDSAVKKTRDGYIVSETEMHGIQRCDSLEAVMKILKTWKENCHGQFFTQSMRV